MPRGNKTLFADRSRARGRAAVPRDIQCRSPSLFMHLPSVPALLSRLFLRFFLLFHLLPPLLARSVCRPPRRDRRVARASCYAKATYASPKSCRPSVRPPGSARKARGDPSKFASMCHGMRLFRAASCSGSRIYPDAVFLVNLQYLYPDLINYIACDKRWS